jgi:hypothetical protein
MVGSLMFSDAQGRPAQNVVVPDVKPKVSWTLVTIQHVWFSSSGVGLHVGHPFLSEFLRAPSYLSAEGTPEPRPIHPIPFKRLLVIPLRFFKCPRSCLPIS